MNGQGIKVFWLGLFLMAALGLMIWLLLFLRPSYGDGKEEILVRFPNVEKVSIGTRVTYAGKPVGTVVAINEIKDAREQPTNAKGDYYFYELVLRLDSSVKIYSSDQIVFTTTGLLGEKSIAILPKPPQQGQKSTEVTKQVLYAESTEGFEESVVSAGKTLENIDELIRENKKELHQMILSVTDAADEIHHFLGSANQMHLAQKAADTFEVMRTVLEQIRDSHLIEEMKEGISSVKKITTGEGTLSRLAESDELYCQVQSVMYELHRLICDINNYGLLFQYNKKWQRSRLLEHQ